MLARLALLLPLGLAIALQPLHMEHRAGEVAAEERVIFSNFTSSLFGSFPISSSDYSTFALAVAGMVAGERGRADPSILGQASCWPTLS
jgi:hypothetical protein